MKHNQKLKKKMTDAILSNSHSMTNKNGKKSKKSDGDVANQPTKSSTDISFMDQGYVRPRVLILCPLRGSAWEIVQSMLACLGENSSISGAEKFEDEFSTSADDDDEEEEEDEDDYSNGDEDNGGDKKKKKNKLKKRKLQQPDDWNAIFKNKNIDDDFKIGIQINPGQGKGKVKSSVENDGIPGPSNKGSHVKLYCDFYQSDIILASPLGLRLLIENSNDKKGAFDFLSSIEVVYLHQSDVLYFQNWEHVEFILQHTNRMPETDHETDFSRVRPYFLDGKASEHRQFILSTNFNEPIIQATFRTYSQSISGSIRLKKKWGDGCITQVISPVKQVFQLIPVPDFETQDELRFQHFKNNVLNQVLRLNQSHTIIITPSYLDFVKVRNELLRREVLITELFINFDHLCLTFVSCS